jgi:hypothetical protein
MATIFHTATEEDHDARISHRSKARNGIASLTLVAIDDAIAGATADSFVFSTGLPDGKIVRKRHAVTGAAFNA